MKRSLLICAAALMMLANLPQADADNVILTLDLRNTNRANAASGGTWSLFVRKVETGTAPQGDFGVAGIRALLANVNEAGITFAAGINQQAGGPYVNTLANGAVEIVYGQNISAAGVVNGIGVSGTATLDRLIASGTWPAGAARPSFTNDGASPTPFTSEVNFLGGAAAPYPNSVQATTVTTEVYTLGDMNNSNTVTSLDIAGFVARLPGASPSLPYNPAADINQSGTVSGLDISPFVAILSGPSVGAIGAVPEPSTIGLAALAAMGMIARRRRAA